MFLKASCKEPQGNVHIHTDDPSILAKFLHG